MGGHRVSFLLGPLPSDVARPKSYTFEIIERGGSDVQGLLHSLVSFIGLLEISNSRQMMLKEISFTISLTHASNIMVIR
jgi:hypothetical protein